MSPRAHRWLAGWLMLAFAAPLWAHHSVVAQYDTTKSISLDGEVRALELGSPHSYLTVQVGQPHGKSTLWRAELASAGFLRRAGWSEQSLSVGERVQLTGSPSRYSATELYATSVTRADGSHLALVPSCVPAAAGDGK